MTVLNGVDVSHYNTVTDWSALARAVGFVIAKASEGTGFTDPSYAGFRASAEAHSILFGAYHFADGGNPAAEARHFLSAASPAPGEVTFLDIEGAILSRTDLVQWVVTWLQTVKAATGALPLTYMSESVLTGHDWSPVVALGAGEWIAYYHSAPPSVSPFPFAALWQSTSRGHVSGISGDVDLDTFYGNAAAWEAYGGRNAPAPAPTPTPAPAPAPTPALPPPAAGQIRVEDYTNRPPVPENKTPDEALASIFAFASDASGYIAQLAAHLGVPASVGAPSPTPPPPPAGTIRVTDYRQRPPRSENLTPDEILAETFAYASNASGRADDIATHLGVAPAKNTGGTS